MVSTTSIGLDVSGDISNVPDHVSAGYRRREIVFERPKSEAGGSSLGTLDATTTWNRGYAIRQTSATGKAAEIAANDLVKPAELTKPMPENPKKPEKRSQPLTFLTRTTVGISASLPSTDAKHTEFTFGYKRYVATRVAATLAGKKLPSTFSDVSVHGGLTSKIVQNLVVGDLNESHRLSLPEGGAISGTPGGTRIRQVFGVGPAINKHLIKKTDAVKSAAAPITP